MYRIGTLVILVTLAAAIAGCHCVRQPEAFAEDPYGVITTGRPRADVADDDVRARADVEAEIDMALRADARREISLPTQAKEDMLVSTEWLASNITDDNLIILDVAENRQRYEAGHIPGAIFVAWDEIATERFDLPGQLPPYETMVALLRCTGADEDSRFVIYSDDGGLAAARMYVILDYLGLGDNASLLDGHFQKWCAEGRNTSVTYPTITASDYTPSINHAVLASLPVVRDASWAASQLFEAPLALVDSRPAPEFAGTTPGEGIRRGGHIPGAVNIPWQRNLVSQQDPTFKSVDELRRMYGTEARIDADDFIIAYCRTGMPASMTYFVLKYIGYDAALYGGSFAEWNVAEDLPVSTAPAVAAAPAQPGSPAPAGGTN